MKFRWQLYIVDKGYQVFGWFLDSMYEISNESSQLPLSCGWSICVSFKGVDFFQEQGIDGFLRKFEIFGVAPSQGVKEIGSLPPQIHRPPCYKNDHSPTHCRLFGRVWFLPEILFRPIMSDSPDSWTCAQ